MVQNHLAGICVDMCKEVGAYPEKCTCPNYVDETDKTPGVVTWEELLKHMDDLGAWGHETLKSWQGELVSSLQWTKKAVKVLQVSKACLSQDAPHHGSGQARGCVHRYVQGGRRLP